MSQSEINVLPYRKYSAIGSQTDQLLQPITCLCLSLKVLLHKSKYSWKLRDSLNEAVRKGVLAQMSTLYLAVFSKTSQQYLTLSISLQLVKYSRYRGYLLYTLSFLVLYTLHLLHALLVELRKKKFNPLENIIFLHIGYCNFFIEQEIFAAKKCN